MVYEIREMDPGNIEDVLAIQFENQLSRWPAESYLAEIENPESIALCIHDSANLTGFILARLITGEYQEKKVSSPRKYSEAEVLNLAISKQNQGKGLGNLLFSGCSKELERRFVKTIWLEVRDSNVHAIRFYKKNGFSVDYIRKNYYSSPIENALVMKKYL